MQLSSRGRPGAGWSSAGALVALLAAGLLAPSTARASCSWHAPAPRGVGAADGLELLSRAAATVTGRPAEQPRPCSGVFCTGNPGLPVVPVTAVTPQPHDWGLLAETPAPPSHHSFPRHHDDDRPRPLHTGLGVFHPPRTGAPV